MAMASVFLRSDPASSVDRAVIALAVFLLFDAQDVRPALDAGEQILAVVGVEEFTQRLDAAHDEQQVILPFEREHSIDEIVLRALLAQLHFEAIGEERQEIVRLRDLAKRQTQIVVDEDADHTQRRTTQRIRIFRAGRLLIDGPEAGENIQFVGQRDGDADRIGWHAIGRALRLVVFLDGGGDAFVLALRQRVVAAHQPLHFGEFTDDFGEQIGLGELRARA